MQDGKSVKVAYIRIYIHRIQRDIMRYNVRLQVEGIEIAGEGAAADTEGITSAVTPGLVRAQAACGRFQPKTIFKKCGPHEHF